MKKHYGQKNWRYIKYFEGGLNFLKIQIRIKIRGGGRVFAFMIQVNILKFSVFWQNTYGGYLHK